MEFRVLGPLEVRDEGRQVQLSPKLQILLAALLSRPGAVVAVDQIIDSLWGQDPPRSAVNTMRGYIHHLRRTLGHDSRIVSQASGYLIVTGPGEVDAMECSALVKQGRKAMADDKLEEASDLFGAALSRWRGRAFAGLDDLPLLREEAVRLNELRLNAFEERIAADLALGRHVELVEELRGFIAAHPYRERPRGQLMLALYRAGRAAEALEVYRDGRAVLADELGLDPGPELRELQRAILAQDPSLDFGPRVSVVAPPAGLPPKLRQFTGRSVELARLRTVLTDRAAKEPMIAAISGPGGVGKSALAIRAAHEAMDHLPDGQLYVNLRGTTPGAAPLRPEAVLGRFLRALGLGDAGIPGETDEAAARFRSLTAGRRMLIVLDDATDVCQVRPLLPGGCDNRVLITSRRVLCTMDDIAHVELRPPPENEAIALLANFGGRAAVEAEPGAAAEVVRWCGNLPLALRIAGARLTARRDLSLAMLCGRLADPTTRLDELRQADLDVRASFAVGLDSLGDDMAGRKATRLFAMIGLLGSPSVTAVTCAALLGGPVDMVMAALDRLVDAQLVEASAGGYRLPPLLRDYARERAFEYLDGPERNAAALRARGGTWTRERAH